MVGMAQIDIIHDNEKTTVIGGGTLDFTNSAQFHEGLKQASLTIDMVIVDLRTAVFIDTAIVQDLARAAVTLRNRGKRLKVVVAKSKYPLEVLQVSGFGSIMDIEIETD